MRVKLLVRSVLIACVVLLVLVSSNSQVLSQNQLSRSNSASTRVLFIGNSYTYFNDGIDRQLIGLAPSTRTSRIAWGGYTLERHWNDHNPVQVIRRGKWNYVVLQEQSQTPIIAQKQFRRFAKAFNQEIKKSGARTILLMTWERPDSVAREVTTAKLASAYTSVGKELGAKVAPAGLAFARSLRQRPDLELYSQDGHPNIYGTYLASCVLYGTIFGKSPVGNSYVDGNIPPNLRSHFQKIAAETLGY